MTAVEQDTPARRDGTTDDIAGLRLYYRLDGAPGEQHIDWNPDRGPTIAEAMAVKAATVSKVNLPRIMAVLQSSAAAADDPEALQALVWLCRRRTGDLSPITALSGLDLLSVRQEYVDAHGVELDFPDPEPSPEERALAADIAADLQRHLPTLPLANAIAAAASLIVAAPPAEAPGEDEAGDQPAAPAPTAAPRKRTRKTSTRS